MGYLFFLIGIVKVFSNFIVLESIYMLLVTENMVAITLEFF